MEVYCGDILIGGPCGVCGKNPKRPGLTYQAHGKQWIACARCARITGKIALGAKGPILCLGCKLRPPTDYRAFDLRLPDRVHEVRWLVCSDVCGRRACRDFRQGRPDARFRCFHCRAEADHLQKCAGCKHARYCGRACQLANWRIHKNICAALRARAKTETEAARKPGTETEAKAEAATDLPADRPPTRKPGTETEAKAEAATDLPAERPPTRSITDLDVLTEIGKDLAMIVWAYACPPQDALDELVALLLEDRFELASRLRAHLALGRSTAVDRELRQAIQSILGFPAPDWLSVASTAQRQWLEERFPGAIEPRRPTGKWGALNTITRRGLADFQVLVKLKRFADRVAATQRNLELCLEDLALLDFRIRVLIARGRKASNS